MNDLLTQGLSSGSPLAFITQGLLLANNIIIECLSVVLSYQVSVLSIVLASSSVSLDLPRLSNNLSLTSQSNQITLSENTQSLNFSFNPSQVILDVSASCPTA